MLKTWGTAFRSGDEQPLRETQRNLITGIKTTKASYAQKIKGNHFFSKNPHRMWRDIKNDKQKSQVALGSFYS